jgi:hypothetical protein
LTAPTARRARRQTNSHQRDRRTSCHRSSAQGTLSRIGLPLHEPVVAPRSGSETPHLDVIRRKLMDFWDSDRKAARFLERYWQDATEQERFALRLELQGLGYRDRQLNALKEWAYDRLHPADDLPWSPLRGKGRPPGRREKPGPSPFPIPSGLPGSGKGH